MDDSEFDAIKSRIEAAALVLRKRGYGHFDPGELGSPVELAPDVIERLENRLDDDARGFCERMIEPLKMKEPRLRCEQCRVADLGLCDVCSAAFHDARKVPIETTLPLDQELLSQNAEHQMRVEASVKYLEILREHQAQEQRELRAALKNRK
jgi:hypothetical protein